MSGQSRGAHIPTTPKEVIATHIFLPTGDISQSTNVRFLRDNGDGTYSPGSGITALRYGEHDLSQMPLFRLPQARRIQSGHGIFVTTRGDVVVGTRHDAKAQEEGLDADTIAVVGNIFASQAR